MGNIILEQKESLVAAISWGAYGGTLLFTKSEEAADKVKNVVESLGGIISVQEKDSISKKVSALCKKSWDIVLKRYGAEVLKPELRNYNFASNPFHWDNALTIQAKIVSSCKKRKINIVKIPLKKICDSVILQLSELMDDDPELKTIFLLVELSKEKQRQRTDGDTVSPVPQELTIIPAPSKLLGREQVVSEIREMLRFSSIVCIHSDGGEGKTAVATVIMDRIRKEVLAGSDEFKHFAWITSQGNLENDLASLISPAMSSLYKDQKELDKVRNFLAEQATFLVIDNVDTLLDSDDIDLLNTFSKKTKVLITSRIRQERITGYKLKELDSDTALVFFYNCYLGNDDSKIAELKARKDTDFVKNITEAVSYNALFIELIGKTARWEYHNKLDDLWKHLKDNIFKASSKINIEGVQHSSSHGLLKNDLKLQDQISRLYALSELPEKCQEIMNFMAQFPAETNVFDDLLNWAGFDINDLKWLTDRAWIEQTKEGYLLHTMVKGSVWMQHFGFDIWKYDTLIEKLSDSNEYMPVTAGHVTIGKRLSPVKVICDLIGDTVKKKLEDSKSDITILTVASSLFNSLASVYHNQGNYEAALKYYRKAMYIREKVLGEKHPSTAIIYNNLALLYQDQGNYEEALTYYQKALNIQEKVLKENHPDTGVTYHNLALLYQAQGKYEEALKYSLKDLNICEEVFGKKSSETGAAYDGLAGVYKDQGNYEEAMECFLKAKDIYEKVLGEEHPFTASTYNKLAGLYQTQENYVDALKYYRKAMWIRIKVFGKEHPSTATTYNNLAAVYQSQKKYEEALKYYRMAMVINEQVLGKEHPSTAATYNNLAVVYQAQGNYEEALKYYQKDLNISEKVLGKKCPSTATTYFNMGILFFDMNLFDNSLMFLYRALSIYEKKLGHNHPNTKMVRENLVHVEKVINKQ